MEFKEVLAKRASVRRFTKDPVPVDHLKELVKAAGMAPSVNNSQPWKFIAITNKAKLENMAKAIEAKIEKMLPANSSTETIKTQVERFSTFFAEAPAVIAVLQEPYKAVVDNMLQDSDFNHSDINKERNYPNIQTIGAAVENILLCAVDMGYGACWLSGPMIAREELEELIGVEKPYKLTTCVAVGKPASDIKPKEKKSIDELFSLLD